MKEFPFIYIFYFQEKKRKLKSETGKYNNNFESIINVKEETKETKPVSQTKLERLKNLEKKAHKEKDDKKIKVSLLYSWRQSDISMKCIERVKILRVIIFGYFIYEDNQRKIRYLLPWHF